MTFPPHSPPEPQDAVRPCVSLIFPAFNEVESAEGMVGFYREIVQAFPRYDFEFVLVDDGSDDGTAETVERQFAAGEMYHIVTLSKNFGSHAAISAGLKVCRGDAAITLSADLQEPLSAISDFLEQWEDGRDIVWGLRSVRAVKKNLSNTLAGVFSHLMHTRSDIPSYPKEGPSQILVNRAVMDVVNSMPELNRNVLGIIAWSGFDQGRIFFEQKPRPYGASKWTAKKKNKLVIDSFVEFSSAPIVWVSVLGLVLGLLGGLLLVGALVATFTGAPSWTPHLYLGSLLLMLFGANFIVLRILGEYLWRAGDDARRRPLYVVRGHRGDATLDGVSFGGPATAPRLQASMRERPTTP